jgi:hypothetical protein
MSQTQRWSASAWTTVREFRALVRTSSSGFGAKLGMASPSDQLSSQKQIEVPSPSTVRTESSEDSLDFRRHRYVQYRPRPIMIRLLKPEPACLQRCSGKSKVEHAEPTDRGWSGHKRPRNHSFPTGVARRGLTRLYRDKHRPLLSHKPRIQGLFLLRAEIRRKKISTVSMHSTVRVGCRDMDKTRDKVDLC